MGRARWTWGLWGAAFGVCFPIVALSLRWFEGGPTGAWAALTLDPLMWIVVTAPLFLGVFAAIGGHQHDQLSNLTAELEARVRLRTRDLAAAVEQLQLITDNVAEGLLTVDLEGQLSGPVSAQAKRWFDAPPPGAVLLDWLRPDDDAYSTFFELGLEQLRDGYLPNEVALDQLPRSFERDGRHYELEARMLPPGAKAPGLLVVIRDVTDRRALAEERAQTEERHAVIANLLRDPSGFVVFRNDCRALLDECKAATSAAVNKAALHTLKGTAAVYGFHSFSSLCHQVEGELSERAQGLLDVHQVERLERCFYTGIEQFGMFMPDESDVVRISRDELLRLAESVESALVRDELFRWTHDPVEPILERLASYGASVAKRLNKDVTFETDGGGARLDLQRCADFVRRLHHLVRNAIDHGVESREERIQAGKPAVATITLTARPSSTGTILCVDDDGRGVDWAKVSERAQALGRPHATPEDRLRALVDGGLSTRREVTEISGRGIGLSAVWSSATALGIDANLESTPGRGTSVRFTIPLVPLSSAPMSASLPTVTPQRTSAPSSLTRS